MAPTTAVRVKEAGLATGFFVSVIWLLDESTAIPVHYLDPPLNPILSPMDLQAISQCFEGLPESLQGLP
jgi:hypothetical protein